MSRHPREEEELTRLISALLDGQWSEAEQARLESLLAGDPHARRLYIQMIDQEIELPCLVASVQGQAAAPDEISSPQNPISEFAAVRTVWRRWVLAAAVALGMLILFIPHRWFHKPSPQSTAGAPSLSESWSEDFENAMPLPWYGRIVTNNLPAGSKYGIAAVVKEYPVGGPAYLVQLPEDWNRGLFALTTGSTLHVTYRLDNRTYVNVFMHTSPVEPGATGYEMYQLKADRFPGTIGRWQTAAIPFSQFVRKVPVEPGGVREFVGGPPRPGEAVTTLAFSSPDPLDLVIDRVWITPTGPAREEIVPTPP